MFKAKPFAFLTIYVTGSVADPAHQIRFSVSDYGHEHMIEMSGTRWQRMLIWLLVNSVARMLSKRRPRRVTRIT